MEIAIDGYSACGKSTLAKSLAKEIDAAYIDTGAMYRAVTLYLLNHNIDVHDDKLVVDSLSRIIITFDTQNGKNDCILNDQNVELEIRSKRVSDQVSEVAAISSVRRKLVDLQRKMSESLDVVMDGRDIGTVVFPNAKFKFFLTADSDIRAERRLNEYKMKGIEANKHEVLKNLEKRDYIDSNREDSPLKVAEDALIVDNTKLTRTEQLKLVLDIIT